MNDSEEKPAKRSRPPFVPLSYIEMRPYMSELLHEAESSLVAGDRWNELTDRARRAIQEQSPMTMTVTEWFSVAQSILAAAAMFSKILWPNPTPEMDDESREWMRRRGKSLRKALAVTSNQALESRAVRNSFEHFDDRLDQIMREKDGAALIDLNVGPAGMVRTKGVSARYMRQIDNTTGIVSVLGESVNLGDLITSMSEIGARAAQWLATAREESSEKQ